MAKSTSLRGARPNTRSKEIGAASQRRCKAKPVRNGSNIPADGAGSSQTKQARIIDRLRQERGAGLKDLIAATGWLPHTTRAALTRLRQGGYAIQRLKDGLAARCIALRPPAPRAHAERPDVGV
jgi:hypothetical protein